MVLMLVPKHVDSNMILHGACPSPEAAGARGKFQLCVAFVSQRSNPQNFLARYSSQMQGHSML